MDGQMSASVSAHMSVSSLPSSSAYRVRPELDNRCMVEGINFPSQGQLPGANGCLYVTLHFHMVVGSGLLEHFLHRGKKIRQRKRGTESRQSKEFKVKGSKQITFHLCNVIVNRESGVFFQSQTPFVVKRCED